jgi:parallel beta-helix repeat protein
MRILALATLLCALLAPPADAASLLVKPDGTGDVATIQAAINASAWGDTVRLADGVFTGPNNVNFGFTGTYVVMISENGPKSTILDAQGTSRVFSNPGGAPSRVVGITLRNGNVAGGGAVDMDNTEMEFENCIFENNTATTNGGAVRIRGNSNPTFRNCTFVFNSSPSGNHLWFQSLNASATIDRCIFAYGGNPGGGVVECNGAPVAWNCNLYFSNAGGNAVCGVTTDDAIGDPLFCDQSTGDYSLDALSPAAGANSACNQLIGACPVLCGATPVETTTWGRLKRTYAN